MTSGQNCSGAGTSSSCRIDTVFSGDIITRIGEDGSVPYVQQMRDRGRFLSMNGKSNVGLGRPLAAV